jgi:translocation protein SEC63
MVDPEIREKWEKYGNPDGPQGISVGIALPRFLVQGENNLLVLGAYILFLVIIFPTIAICYWQKQKSMAHNQLMNKTMQLFYQATNENMRFRKLIEVLAAAFEYRFAIIYIMLN